MLESLFPVLQERGLAVMRGSSSGQARRVSEALGAVICVTQVRLNPSVGSYLASPPPIPLHTDHPAARYIAWFCCENDAVGGESLLVDGRAVVESLPLHLRNALAAARLICPPVGMASGRSDSDRVGATAYPVWDERRRSVFFAPWLPCVAQHQGVLAEFERNLADVRPAAVRLEPGDLLVVDNHRVLHARGRLPADSRRWLTRWWVAQ